MFINCVDSMEQQSKIEASGKVVEEYLNWNKLSIQIVLQQLGAMNFQ